MKVAHLDTALTSAAELEPAPGFVVMASWPRGQQYLRAFGLRGISTAEPMTADSLFWIASFTKLVTSIVALQLIEEGRLSLDQTVASILPTFADLPIPEGFDDAGAPKLR